MKTQARESAPISHENAIERALNRSNARNTKMFDIGQVRPEFPEKAYRFDRNRIAGVRSDAQYELL